MTWHIKPTCCSTLVCKEIKGIYGGDRVSPNNILLKLGFVPIVVPMSLCGGDALRQLHRNPWLLLCLNWNPQRVETDYVLLLIDNTHSRMCKHLGYIELVIIKNLVYWCFNASIFWELSTSPRHLRVSCKMVGDDWKVMCVLMWKW